MSRYTVGQVLFIIDSEKNAVLPCQVIEEVTKKTLEGDQVFYKVIFGVDPKNIMDLSQVKGEIFTSLHDVKKTLLANVTNWVDTHVSKAAKATLAWYKYDSMAQEPRPETPNLRSLPLVDLDAQPIDPEEPLMVEIAPGQFAKAKIKTSNGA